MEHKFENILYASRWLLAPIYLGLSLALLALGIKFFQEALHVLPAVLQMKEADLVLITLSGLVLIAGSGQGPLAGTVLASISGDWLEDVHEFFANFTLLLVIGHVTGVVVSSFMEHENLVRTMLNGRKRYRQQWADDRSAQESSQ
mgnify:CR=1 FL=1